MGGSEGTSDLAHRLERLAWSIFKAQGQPAYRRSLAAARGLASSLRELALEYDGSRSGLSEGSRHECLGLSSLVDPATSRGQALSNLSAARHELELSISGYAALGDSRGLQRASAFLSLVLWMYPGGFSSFADLALEVLEISGKVLELRDITGDLESYCLGLFARLRALPLLVQIGRVKRSVLLESLCLADAASREVSDPFLRGLLLYGSAFARFRSGLVDLGQSLKLFDDAIALLRRSESGVPFVAYALWETGLIYQWELAEGVEDRSSFMGFIEKAYARYRDAWKIASCTTWQRCKGEILYDMAYCLLMMAERELDSQRRLGYLRRSLLYGEDALRWLSYWSPYESDLLGGSWVSAAYRHLAVAESNSDVRRRLNSRALSLYRRAIKVLSIPGLSLPYTLENVGELHLNAARSEHMLSEAASGEKRRRLLRRAAESAERSLQWFREDPDKLAKACLTTGRLFCELSEATGERAWVSKASQVFRRANLLCRRLGWWVAPAECRWNLARAFDGVGDFARSARLYREAARLYGVAGSRLSDLRGSLDGYARAMRAWSLLERGRLWHGRERYSRSARLFLRASRVISDTGWRGYGRLFAALGLIEAGERESAEERHGRALTYFRRALGELKAALEDSKAAAAYPGLEMDVSQGISSVCSRRISFLRGRVLVERARRFSRAGRHGESSRCYVRAVRVFSRLLGEARNPAEAGELELLVGFCTSLAKIETAFQEERADLFGEASTSLRAAARGCALPRRRALLLGMSHLASAMASAAEVKARLEFSVDSDLVSRVGCELRRAADAFGRGGLSRSRDLAKGTLRMFVGSIYLMAGEREVSPEERMRLYGSARRAFAAASSLFSRAGDLERVRALEAQVAEIGEEERAHFSVAEVFGDVVSRHLMYAAVSPSLPVEAGSSGGEFDHAALEVSCCVDRGSVVVGECLRGEVEVVNLGRGDALLLSLLGCVPDGFLVDRHPEGFEVVGGSLALRGLVLRPYSKQRLVFSFRAAQAASPRWRPVAVFRDDLGRERAAISGGVDLRVLEVGESVEDLVRVKGRCLESMRLLSERFARGEVGRGEYEAELLELRRGLVRVEEFENRLSFELEDLGRRVEAVSQRLGRLELGSEERLRLETLLEDLGRELMSKRCVLETLRGVSSGR